MKRWFLNLKDEIRRQGLGTKSGAKNIQANKFNSPAQFIEGIWHLLWEKTRPRNTQLECSQLVWSTTERRRWCLLCSVRFHYML